MYYWRSHQTEYPAHGDCNAQRKILKWCRQHHEKKKDKHVIAQKIENYKTWWGYLKQRKVKVYDKYWPRNEKIVIQNMFWEGHAKEALFLSFDQFDRWVRRLDNERTRAFDWYEGRIYRGFRYEPTAYVKQPYHAKKERSDKYKQKQEWRKEKGFAKDQSKGTCWHRNCPKWVKQHCNQQSRRNARRLIKAGRYDHLFTHDYPVDTWMWD